MAIISGGDVKIPRGNTVLQAGDRLLLLADIDEREALVQVLGL